MSEESKKKLQTIEPSSLEINGKSISTLPPKQQRFFHLYITGRYSNIEIADLLGVHVNTVSNWLRQKDFSEFITAYQEEEHKANLSRIKALTNKALDTMDELLDSPIDGIRYQASKDILDRANFKPKQEIKVDKSIVSYEERIERLIDETISTNDIIELSEGDYEVVDNE